MKTIISRTVVPLLLIILSAGLVSFSGKDGGDVFEVYIGKTLMVQQALHNDKGVKEISLNAAHYNEKLSIRYSHCGVVGKKRVITLKDENNRVLKQLNFSEARTSNSVMVCNVNEIMDLQKSGNTIVRVYYSSAELPEGKWLVSLVK